ncbi:hypothetical protein ACLB2K_071637 [Fragaria x ananassa]
MVGHTIDRCKHRNKESSKDDYVHSKRVVEGSKHPKPVIRQEYRVKSKPSAQQSLPTKAVSDVGITQFVDQALKEVVDNELDRIAGLVINECTEPSVNLVNDSVLNGNKFSILHENDT